MYYFSSPNIRIKFTAGFSIIKNVLEIKLFHVWTASHHYKINYKY